MCKYMSGECEGGCECGGMRVVMIPKSVGVRTSDSVSVRASMRVRMRMGLAVRMSVRSVVIHSHRFPRLHKLVICWVNHISVTIVDQHMDQC